MGISKEMVEFNLKLFKQGIFKGFNSVMELGAQDLQFDPSIMYKILKQELGGDQANNSEIEILIQKDLKLNEKVDAAWLYRQLGFAQYHCIDANGQHNAYILDLNFPVPEDHKGQYDLITNYGTAEHVFNVYQFFKNVHDLSHESSIMIHTLPFQKYVNHGFYNFQPCFYDDLAYANNYEIIERYIDFHDINNNLSEATIVPYSKEILLEKQLLSNSLDLALIIVMKRTSEKEFVMPYQGLYRYSCKLPSYVNTLLEDLKRRVDGRPIVIFGAGSSGKEIINWLKDCEIYPVAVIDNNSSKWNSTVGEIVVKGPEYLNKSLFTIVASNWFEDIVKQMEEFGFEAEKDFIVVSV